MLRHLCPTSKQNSVCALWEIWGFTVAPLMITCRRLPHAGIAKRSGVLTDLQFQPAAVLPRRRKKEKKKEKALGQGAMTFLPLLVFC